MKKRFGVAILANDGIYDWLLPFLESFREHNPTLPTYLIPFDRRMERATPTSISSGGSERVVKLGRRVGPPASQMATVVSRICVWFTAR